MNLSKESDLQCRLVICTAVSSLELYTVLRFSWPKVLRVKAALGGLSRSQEQLASAVDAALSPPPNLDATNHEDAGAGHSSRTAKPANKTASGTHGNSSSDVKALHTQLNSLSQVCVLNSGIT